MSRSRIFKKCSMLLAMVPNYSRLTRRRTHQNGASLSILLMTVILAAGCPPPGNDGPEDPPSIPRIAIDAPCDLVDRIDTSSVFPDDSDGEVVVVCDNSKHAWYFLDYTDPDRSVGYQAEHEAKVVEFPEFEAVVDFAEYCAGQIHLRGVKNWPFGNNEHDIKSLVIRCS